MMKQVINFLEDIKIGARQSYKNMTLFCLLSARESETDFVMLDDALTHRFLSITEIDEGGHVPQLKVVNKSDWKVLMLDGEELIGAKQNRALNITVLIGPQSETVIPVSCVEQGRWSYKSKEFGSARRSMSADLKRKKTESVRESLRTRNSFESDQGTVWAEIDTKFVSMEVGLSPTMAMSDLYDSVQDRSEEFSKAFRPVDNQVGMIVLVDGEVVGMELVGRFEAFRKAHEKLVSSYVMDALETADESKELATRTFKGKAQTVLRQASEASIEGRSSVALGQDISLDSDRVFGAGLEFEGDILQLSVFLKDSDESGSGRRGSIRSASTRRRYLL